MAHAHAAHHRTHREIPDEVESVLAAVRRNNLPALRSALHRLVVHANRLELPADFLARTAGSVATGNWEFFPSAFQKLEFLGAHNDFLLLAPFTTSRDQKSETRLSALYGSRLDLGRMPETRPVLLELFGTLRQEIPLVIPVRAYGGAGWLSGQAGEAFIVPNAWTGLESGNGPALNNMSEQSIRVGQNASKAIRKIFDDDAADLLLSVYRTQLKQWRTMQAEYQLHESGHAAGLGLNYKLSAGVMNSPWVSAVEEFRSDGVAFEIARRILPLAAAGALVSSNLITRFGIDAHRSGGLNRDTDVNCALLTFNALFHSGMLRVGASGKLRFERATREGLVMTAEPMREMAVALTRAELRLNDPQGIKALYDAVSVPEAVRRLFQEKVLDPARDIYTDLR